MEHQPFETWILEDTPLSAAQERELHSHLAGCAACQELRSGWQSARATLRSAAPADPQPGFARRFQSGLAERKARQQLQVRRTVLGLSAGALLVGALIVAAFLLRTSPAGILAGLLGTALALLTTITTLQGILRTWLNVLPPSLLLAVWIPLSTGFAILIAGWVFSLWRVSTQGATNS